MNYIDSSLKLQFTDYYPSFRLFHLMMNGLLIQVFDKAFEAWYNHYV